MIIPVRCFTCGEIIGNLWEKYKEEVFKERQKRGEIDETRIKPEKVTVETLNKETPEYIALEKIGIPIHKYCCRSHFITNPELIEKLV